jgi:hypothetical protein
MKKLLVFSIFFFTSAYAQNSGHSTKSVEMEDKLDLSGDKALVSSRKLNVVPASYNSRIAVEDLNGDPESFNAGKSAALKISFKDPLNIKVKGRYRLYNGKLTGVTKPEESCSGANPSELKRPCCDIEDTNDDSPCGTKFYGRCDRVDPMTLKVVVDQKSVDKKITAHIYYEVIIQDGIGSDNKQGPGDPSVSFTISSGKNEEVETEDGKKLRAFAKLSQRTHPSVGFRCYLDPKVSKDPFVSVQHLQDLLKDFASVEVVKVDKK